MRFSDSEHVGEDSRQKALIKAWRAFPRFRADCHFKSWIYKIIRNVVYDYSAWKKRKGEISLEGSFYNMSGGAGPSRFNTSVACGDCNISKRRTMVFAKNPTEPAPAERGEAGVSLLYEKTIQNAPSPDDVLQRREDMEELGKNLKKSLERLKPEHEECLRHLSEGLTYEEIAKLQKVPLGTIMSRVFYARKAARRYCSHLEDFKV
jgi:RNA polymerase sigma factor (sigma-70 family)